jgi:hypothetical protein
MLNNFGKPISRFLLVVFFVVFAAFIATSAFGGIHGPIIDQDGFKCFLYDSEEDLARVKDELDRIANIPGSSVTRDETVQGRTYFWVENKSVGLSNKTTWEDGMICEAIQPIEKSSPEFPLVIERDS